MNILTQGFIRGLEGFITAKSDLDRLKHMPQRVEDGRLVNFKGHKLTAKIDGLEDFVIMDADKVNDAKRFTSALLGTYLEGFSKLQGVEDDTTTENTNNEPTLEDLLLDAVEVGDKKEVRNICKQLKEQWFALDDDVVEDAIDDIKDCVADKDVKAVEDILDSLGKTNDKEPEQQVEVKKSAPELVKEIVKEETQTNDDDLEDLLLDIQDAIKDEDVEDVELLLKELGEEHPRYKEFSISLATLKGEDAVIEPEKNEDDEIDDIIADLEDAIKENDIDGENGAKVILEELKELVGEDDEDYIKFNKIVNPTTNRRSRRERRGK